MRSFKPSASRLAAVILACICSPLMSAIVGSANAIDVNYRPIQQGDRV